MLLVEVDVVGAQAAQAGVGGPPHVFRPGALPAIRHLHAEFGGYNHTGATGAQRAAQEFLAAPFAVHVGGVEKIDAGVERGLHHPGGGFGVDAPAEIIAAQPHQRHFQRSNAPRFHVFSSFAFYTARFRPGTGSIAVVSPPAAERRDVILIT